MNGQIVPRDQAVISPDDRGFLFGDSVYEVVRWYGGYFFDMEGHMNRLRRSLNATRILWQDVDSMPEIAEKLIHENNLGDGCSLVYIQVTRGAAPRNHAFPDPAVLPTVYISVRRQSMDTLLWERGIAIAPTPDPRWNRCDIKSTALLANILPYQDAHDNGFAEVCFIRNGFVTEGAHSNIFFVKGDTVFTHPESNSILSGITRKNVISIAAENGIKLVEEAVAGDMIPYVNEAFITNTSGEVIPVIRIGDQTIGNGTPGDITKKLQRLFREKVMAWGTEHGAQG
ncbi:MAG TPA: aminotransferase class IV [Bacteroidales bacterium]|nr:aminotransferase class IV [Bacteroidales bacterium]